MDNLGLERDVGQGGHVAGDSHCVSGKSGCMFVCVCLLLQDLLQSCVRGGEGDSEGHVL